MCLLFGVLWLLTYPNGPNGPSTREVSISRNYTFIVNGALAGMAMVGVQEGNGGMGWIRQGQRSYGNLSCISHNQLGLPLASPTRISVHGSALLR